MVALWRRLGIEQKVAAAAAVLLIVSTFGPFSMVEAATVLDAGAVLTLLRARALGRHFHLPGGDGLVLIVAAGWAALLMVARILDRPLGQTVLALGCAAILAGAGLRERVRRPPDDIAPPAYRDASPPPPPDADVTEPLRPDADVTIALPSGSARPVRKTRSPRPDGPPRPR